jgi:type I restriction enzyme M protein
VVDLLDAVPMEDRDTKGDVYEYMLGKIASAGQNGQFRTPRHIIRLMVELTSPQPADVICDPACGTAGFLVTAGEVLRERHPNVLHDAKLRAHFHQRMFHGFDFDNTMLRIGSMNMLLHGVENPDIRYRDSLAQDHAGEEEKYTLVLANPPFAGSLDYENTAKDLLQIVKTKKTELLFLALFLRLLKPGGRAAVIVPDGVLFGSSTAHKELRRMLVEDQKLDAVVKLPGGVFRPYAGVSTAILLFTKTNSGGTDFVWFYDVGADGWSLDDKRTPLLPEDKLGPVPRVALSEDEHDKNNLPDVLARWVARDGAERERARTAQSFCVPKADIAAPPLPNSTPSPNPSSSKCSAARPRIRRGGRSSESKTSRNASIGCGGQSPRQSASWGMCPTTARTGSRDGSTRRCSTSRWFWWPRTAATSTRLNAALLTESTARRG